MEKYLVINADDFGRSPEVNDGILHAYRNGLVSSTTLMANFDAFDDAVAKIKKHKVPVGLHINLTDGRPVSRPDAVPSLLDPNGQFYKKYEFYRRVVTRRIRPADIQTEVTAQLHRCVQSGIDLDHYDGHHHVHAIRGAAPVVRSVMNTYRFLPFRRISWPHKTQARSSKIQQIAIHIFEDRIPQLPFSTTFWGFDFMDLVDKRSAFLTMLHNIRPGLHEMMCHPGYVSAEKISYYNAQRQVEVELLCEKTLKTTVEELNIKLCSYQDIWREFGQ